MASWLGVLFAAIAAIGDAQAPARDHEKLAGSILYAGYPGGEREHAWVEFLGQWFTRVEAIDLRQLDERTARTFDVVVADWKPRYVGGKYQEDTEKHGKSLPFTYSKPTILIGAIAAEITPRIKLDWL